MTHYAPPDSWLAASHRVVAPTATTVSPAEKPLVLVVEDDPDLRDVLCVLLKSAGISVESYANAEKFLHGYNSRRPGCVLLDMHLPDMTGLEVQQRLASQSLSPAIIFLTGHGDVPSALQAMRCGAVDYIQKPFCAQLLLTRIQEAIARDLETRRLHAAQQVLENRVATLSGRERQVMALMTLGHSTKEIAARLGISSKTVDKHRAKVLDKMQVDNAIELTHLLLSRPEQALGPTDVAPCA